MSNRRKRRVFSREFKVEAVQMMSSPGMTVAQAARDLDIDAKMLRRWRRELEQDPTEAFPGEGKLKSDDQKIRDLQREVERLRMERDILKKAVGIFSQSPRR